MATAIGEPENCPICGKFYNPLDPLTRSPTCSQACWQIWIKFIHHGGFPCWIAGCKEVDCGVRTPGYCDGCEVFKVEQAKGKRKEERNNESY